MKLEPHRIGGERSARQSRPLDRALAFLDPLLARPALVTTPHLGWRGVPSSRSQGTLKGNWSRRSTDAVRGALNLNGQFRRNKI